MCSVVSGEPLKWKEKCHIKHLPTRQYLTVVGSTASSNHYKVSVHVMSVYVVWPVGVMILGKAHVNVNRLCCPLWYTVIYLFSMHVPGMYKQLHFITQSSNVSDLFQCKWRQLPVCETRSLSISSWWDNWQIHVNTCYNKPDCKLIDIFTSFMTVCCHKTLV